MKEVEEEEEEEGEKEGGSLSSAACLLRDISHGGWRSNHNLERGTKHQAPNRITLNFTTCGIEDRRPDAT